MEVTLSLNSGKAFKLLLQISIPSRYQDLQLNRVQLQRSQMKLKDEY